MIYAASSVLREDWLAYVREGLGSFRAFELACAEPRVVVSAGELEALARLREKEGLRYSVHAPFRRLDVGSASESLQRRTEKLYRRSLEVAADVGAELVVMHPSMVGEGEWSALPARAQAALRAREKAAFERLGRRANALGVRIGVENMPRHRAARHAGWLHSLLEGFEGLALGVTVDVGHAQTCGIPPSLFLEEFAPRLFHVHAHDNSGQGDEHRAVGDGSIDWAPVARALVAADFRGLVADEALNLPAQLRGKERLLALLERAARARRTPDPSPRKAGGNSSPRRAKKLP